MGAGRQCEESLLREGHEDQVGHPEKKSSYDYMKKLTEIEGIVAPLALSKSIDSGTRREAASKGSGVHAIKDGKVSVWRI